MHGKLDGLKPFTGALKTIETEEIEMQQPKLPDPGICKTTRAFEGYWECLVEKCDHCPYVFPMGSGYFCNHPDNSHYANQSAN